MNSPPHHGSAVAVTPGWLRSEKMLEAFGVTEDNWREATVNVPHFCIAEIPGLCRAGGRRPRRRPGRRALDGHGRLQRTTAPLYGFTDTDGTRPDCWRYVVEVQDRGLPADDTGYR